MTSIVTMQDLVKKSKTDIASLLAPFFPATVNFKNEASLKAGSYNCPMCGDDIGDVGATVAISYVLSRYGTWLHPDCVVKKGKQTITQDMKAKMAAKKAAQEQYAARQATRRANDATNEAKAMQATATATLPALKTEVQIRAEIEAEYEARMLKAIDLIERLKAENVQLRDAMQDYKELANVA